MHIAPGTSDTKKTIFLHFFLQKCSTVHRPPVRWERQLGCEIWSYIIIVFASPTFELCSKLPFILSSPFCLFVSFSRAANSSIPQIRMLQNLASAWLKRAALIMLAREKEPKWKPPLSLFWFIIWAQILRAYGVTFEVTSSICLF